MTELINLVTRVRMAKKRERLVRYSVPLLC